MNNKWTTKFCNLEKLQILSKRFKSLEHRSFWNLNLAKWSTKRKNYFCHFNNFLFVGLQQSARFLATNMESAVLIFFLKSSATRAKEASRGFKPKHNAHKIDMKAFLSLLSPYLRNLRMTCDFRCKRWCLPRRQFPVYTLLLCMHEINRLKRLNVACGKQSNTCCRSTSIILVKSWRHVFYRLVLSLILLGVNYVTLLA